MDQRSKSEEGASLGVMPNDRPPIGGQRILAVGDRGGTAHLAVLWPKAKTMSETFHQNRPQKALFRVNFVKNLIL